MTFISPPNNSINYWRGFSALLAAGMILGTFGVLIRWLDEEMSAMQQIALRHVAGFVLAILIITIRKPSCRLSGVQWPVLLAYAVAFPLSIIAFTYSVISTKISIAVFALYGGSLLTAQVGGTLFFSEKVDGHRIIIFTFGVIGLTCMVIPSIDRQSLNLGLLLGFIAGVLDGFANFLRKYLAEKIDRLVLVALQLLGGLLIALLVLAASSEPFPTSLTVFSFVVVVVFGALILTITYLTLLGFRYFDLGLGTLVLSSELIFAPLFAMLFFSEFPTPSEWFGGGFILLAVMLLHYRPARPP